MREAKKSMAAKLEGTVKEVLGTCMSIGCTVDHKPIKEITAMVNSGEYRCDWT